jgi:hypothetical protein
MRALFDLFLDICLFRKGPQDLPASAALLKLSLMLYALSGLTLFMIYIDHPSLVAALLLTLLDIALLAVLSYAVLYVLGYLTRFTQTLTALTGVGVLLQVVDIPLAVWIRQEIAAQGAPEFPVIMHYMLVGWSIAVMGYILQHAFSTSRMIGVLYAMAYVAISWTLFDWLQPPPVTVS